MPASFVAWRCASFEVGRDGNDGVGDRLAEIGLCSFLHLLKNECRYLRRRELFSLHLDPGIPVAAVDDLVGQGLDVPLDNGVADRAPDQPLDGKQRSLGIGHGLAFGCLSHEPFVIGEADDRTASSGILPSFRRLLDCVPSMTATQEFVVPRSIPMTLDIWIPFIGEREQRHSSSCRIHFTLWRCPRNVPVDIGLYRYASLTLQARGDVFAVGYAPA